MVCNSLWVLPLIFPRKFILRTLAYVMESTDPEMACKIALGYEPLSFNSFSIHYLSIPVLRQTMSRGDKLKVEKYIEEATTCDKKHGVFIS